MYKCYIKLILASVLIMVLPGCVTDLTGKNANDAPRTLNQAIERHTEESGRAIVFATYQEGEDDLGVGAVAKALLFGNRENVPGIIFDGSPYDQNNKSPHRGLHVLEAYVGKDVIPAYQGNFSIMGNKNWAYVYPTKYAASTVISKHQKAARIGGWTRKNKKAYLVFDVQPGEMLYLGHIRTNWVSDENIGFIVEDKFEEFRHSLPETIRHRVHKRLLKAPAYISADDMKIERTINYSSSK